MIDKALQNYDASDLIMELFPSLPEGWTGKRLKYLSPIRFSNVDKKSDPDQNEVLLCNYVDAYKNNFITSKLDFMKATATPEEIRKFSLLPNDVLITKDSETADDIGVPSFIAEKIDNLVCGYHLAILRVFPILMGKYLFRYLQSTLTASFFEKRANGITRFAIGMDTVGNCPVIFPALQNQHTIAFFLDKETSRIDALISKKEKQVELLQEKRQAIITRTVTKGLDPNAKMKDSGVEWIGRIPEEWTMTRMRRVGYVDQGCSFPYAIQGKEEGAYPWYKVGDMNSLGNEVTMRKADNYADHRTLVETGARLLPANSIVFPRVGAALLTNKRRILTEPSVVDDNVYAFIPTSIHFGYAYYFLTLIDFGLLKSPGLVPTITFSTIKDILIPLPPPPQQISISQRLNDRTAQSDRTETLVRRSIEVLQEYRSSLITAVVSGQIDVSKMKAPE